jgi:hypothetical protein
MKVSSAIGGLAGAVALTLINQGVQKVDKNAPRLDLLGKNAVAKMFKGTKAFPGIVQKLLPASLAGDLVSNSLYYAMAKGGNKQQTLIRGALLGLGAGLGAVGMPKKLGLNEEPTNKTTETKVLTVVWYMLGGIVAAAAINLLENTSLDNKTLS